MALGGGPKAFGPCETRMAKRNRGSLWNQGSRPAAISGGTFLIPLQKAATAAGLLIQFRNSHAASLCAQAAGITKTLPPAPVVSGRPPGGAGSENQPHSRLGA